VKPDVALLDREEVIFRDGSRQRFDAIIHATGYRTTFPFLSTDIFDGERRPVRLFRRIVAPDRRGLFFAGLVQPIGPTIPLVETQGSWIAGVLADAVALPDATAMDREIDDHVARQRRTYVDSERYALEVDYRLYTRQLRADIAAGAAGG